MTESHYVELIKSVFRGRRWLFASDVAVNGAARASKLQRYGALPSLVIGASRGAGTMPEDVEVHTLDVSAEGMMASIRAAMAALQDLPPAIQQRVDAWDPTEEARCIGTLFAPDSPVAGREMYGARPPEWAALEDKTTVDALWDELGVRRGPFEVVPCTHRALMRAHARLDQGLGTVWAGDNRSGWHGGASYLRWVRSPADAEEATEWLASACDTARVQPFMEGVPCSIHGIVFPDYVVALRPCEMVVFRVPGTNTLRYAQAATFWDPAPADRVEMRALAKRVGVGLRQRYGYRGTFTIDGIMSEQGFLPTELNPRYGAAIGVMSRALEELPLYLLHLTIVEGEPLDYRPEELERFLLELADGTRSGGGSAMVPVRPEETRRAGLLIDDRVRFAGEEDTPDASVLFGPYAGGGFLKVSFDPDRTPIGYSTAERVARCLRFLDAQWELGLGPIEAARPVR